MAILLFSLAAVQQLVPPRAIPCSPMTPAETASSLEEIRDSLIADGASEEEIDSIIVKLAGAGACTFRDSDIRKVVPQLKDHAIKAHLCSNVVMASAAEIAYVAKTDQPHQVLLTRLDCAMQMGGGLLCHRIEETQAWYQDDPRNFFELDNGIPFDWARTLIALSRNMGISGVPDHLRQFFSADMISSVGVSPYGMVIRFHRGSICGCYGALTVVPNFHEVHGPPLKVATEPVAICA